MASPKEALHSGEVGCDFWTIFRCWQTPFPWKLCGCRPMVLDASLWTLGILHGYGYKNPPTIGPYPLWCIITVNYKLGWTTSSQRSLLERHCPVLLALGAHWHRLRTGVPWPDFVATTRMSWQLLALEHRQSLHIHICACIHQISLKMGRRSQQRVLCSFWYVHQMSGRRYNCDITGLYTFSWPS